MKRRVTVVRCPRCGSTHAGTRGGLYEFEEMGCQACGHSDWCDEHQLRADWNVELEVEEGQGLPARLPPLSARP